MYLSCKQIHKNTYTLLATATVSVAKPHLIGENDEPVNLSPEADLDDFWHTSVGKFRFTIEELPEQLQYIHKLLKVYIMHGIVYNTDIYIYSAFIYSHYNYVLDPTNI